MQTTHRSTGRRHRLRSGGRLGAILAGLLAPIWVAAQPARRPVEIHDLRELEHAFTRLAEMARPSAVAISTYTLGPLITSRDGQTSEGRVRQPRTNGTGAILTRDGLILTNTHVIEDADVIEVTLDDRRLFEAKLILADQRCDLAVVKIDATDLEPIRYADPDRLQVGQWCFAIGNPFGLAGLAGGEAFTYGIVSATGRDLSAELNDRDQSPVDARYYGDMIQTSAAINPGNSGGPLFNIDGQMIGVVTAIRSNSGVSEGAGFAIPINARTRQIIDALSRGERVQYGYLGVEVEPPTPAVLRAAGLTQRRGAVIKELSVPDGPAAQAELRPGDLIVEFNGVPIESTIHLVSVVQSAPVGQPAEVVYYRADQRRTTPVTLAARPVGHVAAGSDASGSRTNTGEPRMCHWRGAWLAEPTDDILREYGLTRRQIGLVVTEVDPGGDARKAGLEPQQIVLRVNRLRVRTIEEFLSAAEQAGEDLQLQVRAAGEDKIIRFAAPSQSS